MMAAAGIANTRSLNSIDPLISACQGKLLNTLTQHIAFLNINTKQGSLN